MKNRSQFLTILLFSIMLTMGLVLRFLFLPAKTVDMHAYFLWFDYIVEHGIVPSLGSQYFGYNPPFIYLLALASLAYPFLPKIVAIKLIPIAFDMINTVLVYQIVKTRFPDGNKPFLAALVFLLIPTVMINSSFWGQTDSLYTCFLLLAILYLLKDRPTAALISFALSISVKAQGIFLAPLLGVLFFQKRIRWYSFFLVPIVYMLTFIPTILAGRPLTSLFSTYAAQAETFSRPSMNAANFYYFLGREDYRISLMIGIPLAALLLLIWVLVYGRKKYFLTPDILTFTALTSVALMPFLLPKMIDRYFYPADVLSLIVAFFVPGMWFLPVVYQIISLFSYLTSLYNLDSLGLISIAAVINFLTICFLLWKQWKMVDTIPN